MKKVPQDDSYQMNGNCLLWDFWVLSCGFINDFFKIALLDVLKSGNVHVRTVADKFSAIAKATDAKAASEAEAEKIDDDVADEAEKLVE